ncbi:MAG TPA: peptidyl-prolyl cis-trans isomerase [Gammaproteobacteria bacterium]|nr:peptidyl-prolyl cis-trans isomerase [Gammaproteobacteria bacterium]
MKTCFLFILVFVLSACQKGDEQTTYTDNSETIAVVGDKAITANLLKAYLNANGISKTDGPTLNQALENLITEIAIANVATKKGLKLTDEQLLGIEYIKIKALVSEAQGDYLKQNTVTDEEIQQAYDAANQQVGGFEYHVHHLLYKDEIEAIKALDEIKSVEDYLEKEKQFLAENPGMRNVGDISWVNLGRLPEKFREVLPNAEENSVIKTVVSSPFGAHVVYLEAKRPITPPKLEDVKQAVIKTVQQQKLSKFSQLARAKANVTIKE